MILERQLDLTQHPVIIVGIRFLGRQQFEQQKKVKYNIKINAETCVSPKSWRVRTIIFFKMLNVYVLKWRLIIWRKITVWTIDVQRVWLFKYNEDN